MRKLHKNQILELTATLNEACRDLKKAQDKEFVGLCIEIQDFVSGIFAYVETVVGEDSALSNHLRKFYELIFHAAQGEADVKQLLKAVHEIIVSANALKPDQMEVVFFCYKASMSDCFESVYFAAKEDPACDVYFVPIPYFDRNLDGSFAKMHLEGEGCYSDKYELTDWQSYDVTTRRPDVIFIMNPYDNQNRVTSVHPDFYSSRLKECTDTLVYIEYGLPYWVAKDPHTEEIKEKYREEGTILPAYLHCDYSIVYSKELAEGYVPLFEAHPEVAKPYGLTPKRVREKFIPLGSPKFDKVVNSSRDNYLLPEDWQRKVSGKKVLLYNTSLGELLKSSAQQSKQEGNYSAEDSRYFRKMREIIESFDGRKDVILWWRPHPLFESTLQSMRPELYEEYEAMMQKFKNADCGIFDDTEDLHRAIAWSDGMISDESSLLLLYTITGKPFYIPAISKALAKPKYHEGKTFQTPFAVRIKNMRAAKGANILNWNYIIWWGNFMDDYRPWNIRYKQFSSRFIEYVVNQEKYEDASEYERLQKQMIVDFAVHSDGTAGQKIYDFVKEKVLSIGGRK